MYEASIKTESVLVKKNKLDTVKWYFLTPGNQIRIYKLCSTEMEQSQEKVMSKRGLKQGNSPVDSPLYIRLRVKQCKFQINVLVNVNIFLCI